MHLIDKRGLKNSISFCFRLDSSFYHFCLLIIAMFDFIFNFDVVVDKKCTIVE